MGITNLAKLIKEFAPKAVINKKITEYKTLCIDTSNYIYKYEYHSYDGTFLDGAIRQMIFLLQRNILPIYVFDGKPPKEKHYALEKRNICREKQKNTVECLKIELDKITNELDKTNFEKKIKKLEQSSIKITKQHFKDLKELIIIMGATYLEATGEADHLCAELVRKGICDACITEDMDILVSGATILRDFRTSTELVTEYKCATVCKELGLTYEQFVDLGILCGYDSRPTIKGIGWKTAYKLIKEKGSIEAILETKTASKEFTYELFRKQLTMGDEKFEKLTKWLQPKNRDKLAITEFIKNKGITLSVKQQMWLF